MLVEVLAGSTFTGREHEAKRFRFPSLVQCTFGNTRSQRDRERLFMQPDDVERARRFGVTTERIVGRISKVPEIHTKYLSNPRAKVT